MPANSAIPDSPKPLAIVGLACRLPGADNLDEFWQLLLRGGSDLGELPSDRFDRELVFDPERGARAKSYSTIGGVCRSIPFDPTSCPVPPELVKDLDKAHLALCEVAADACRSGKLDPFDLPHRHTGVYVGHTRGTGRAGDFTYGTLVETTAQYLREIKAFQNIARDRIDDLVAEIVEQVRSETPQRNEDGGPDLSASMAAGLISMAFGLDGPYCSLNAACASSLQAMALGARALQLGQIDMAIVGGASHCKSDSLVLFSQARSVSDTGSRPFDADADGLVTSEGYVIVLLKTLERALADRNEIFAVIRGIGVSSDGRGKSLWAPRKEGQIEAIHRAYGAGVDMSRVQYVEAHATSTQVGDATEVSALAEAMCEKLPPGTRIPMGSVKANVGHTLETAGMAGLAKTILSMRHGIIPPQINLNNLNPKIDWDHIPFFVPTEALEWKAPADGQPRRAAVNAFGIGGLNVHVVLDEYKPEQARQLLGELQPERRKNTISASSHHEPIAIVGAGAVLPGALTIDGVWELFASGRNEIHDLPDDRWDSAVSFEPGSRSRWKSPTKLAGCIRDFHYDWKRHKVPPKQIGAADPLQFMLLDAVDQAFRVSGYHEKPFDRKRTGVLVGTIFGGDFANQLQMGLRLPEFERSMKHVLDRHGVPPAIQRDIAAQYGDILMQRMPALEDETGSFTSSTLASRITKSFDLMGGAAALDGNTPSALAVLAACIDQLRTREVDMMVCAAGQRTLGLPIFAGLSLSGLLARGKPHAPFDAESDGYVPGEGVGVLLLKRLSDARRDGDNILGMIHGVGIARGTDLSSAIATGARRCLEASQIDPRDVTCLESGSTGVPAIDRQELDGMAQAYGTSREMPLLLGTASGQVGFSAGCSGMTSLVKAMYQLQETEVAPRVGLSSPAPFLREHGDIFSIGASSQAIPVAHPEGRLFAGVNSFGKWNLAYHAILERPTPVPMSGHTKRRHEVPSPVAAITESSGDEPWRIVRIQAPTLNELCQVASDAKEHCGELFAEEETVSFQLDQHRLAIVTNTRDNLVRLLDLFVRHAADQNSLAPLEERGLFYGRPKATIPKVAFLFAGQGSQYADMMRPLVEGDASLFSALEEIDENLCQLGFPKFADFAWNDGSALGQDVWLTQLSLLIADSLMYRALHSLGLRADRVAGHSYGEFPALVASEAWSFSEAARATYARCRAVERCFGEKGGMLAISGGLDQVRAWIEESRAALHVSHVNTLRQTVVSGEETAVREFASELQRRGVSAKMVPVPRPFHTPLMGNARSGFTEGLAKVHLEPPCIPLLSSVTNRYVSDPFDIRRNLVQQLVTPVNYVKLIDRLANDGIQVFVEVGPRQILTRLHKQILAGRDVAVIAGDHPKRTGLPQLLHVQACYEVAGAMLREPRRSHSDAVHRTLASVGENSGSSAALAISDASDRRSTSGGEIVGEAWESQVEIAMPDSGDGRSAYRSPRSTSRTDDKAGSEPAEKKDITKTRESPRPRAELPLATLILTGTPYERGRIHGSHRRKEIRRVLRRNTATFSNRIVSSDAIRKASQHVEAYFDSESLEEIRGMATGAGVSVESLIAINLQFYPDISAGCCQFAIRAEVNGKHHLVQGANEDLPIGLVLRDVLTHHIQVVQPPDGIRYVTFPIAGQVGSLSGMNAKGIAVTSAMLLDLPRQPEAGPGRLHGLIVRDILAQADSVEAALRVVQAERGVGAWSLCISHFPSDEIVLIEYDGSDCHIARSRGSIIASNHTHLHTPRSTTPDHSQFRLQRLVELLGHDENVEVSASRLQEALRDLHDGRHARIVANPTMNTIRRVDNQMSIVFQPEAGRAWLNVAGSQPSLPDQYFPVDLGALFQNSLPRTTALPASRRPDETATTCSSDVSTGSWNFIRSGSTQHDFPTENRNREGSFHHVIAQEEFLAAARSVNGGPPAGSQDRICQRFVMRVMESPLQGTTSDFPVLSGAALILGDNDLARRLSDRLRSRGCSVRMIPTNSDPAKVIAELERCWEAQPAPHLFLTTPFEPQPMSWLDEAGWNDRRRLGISTPYLAAQRWYQLMLETNLLDRGSIVACTKMGGDFGFSDQVPAVESGALTGLMKALSVEIGRTTRKPFLSKVIDSASELPLPLLVDSICRELAGNSREVEVGFDSAGHRYVVRPIAEPVEQLPRHDPDMGGAWVVTGGARGVTAVVAREMGLRFGLKLHLVGSSPLPRIEETWRDLDEEGLRALRAQIMRDAVARGEVPAPAWGAIEKSLEIDTNLRDFQAAGLNVSYHACDVGDRAALDELLNQIRAEDGPIRGVIHGAGFERACRFDRKNPELVERTISAKVDAAAHLMDLTRDDPLQAFLAFGSISGRFGGNGQTDYCLANELLSKLVHWYRRHRPECQSGLFHWHSWDEVGMAVRPESLHIKKLFQFRYMPTREGVAHLIEEFRAGMPEGEILVTDWNYYKRFYPDQEGDVGTVAPDSTTEPMPRATTPQPDSAAVTNVREETGAQANVVHRHTLRMQPAPLPPNHRVRPELHGPVLILGDNADAESLAAEIQGLGQPVHLRSLDADRTTLLDELDRLWQSGPIPHLFLFSARDAAARERKPELLRDRLMKAYLLGQHWARRLAETSMNQPGSLVAVTSLGGDFGFANALPAPEGGAITGWLKSVYVETCRQQRQNLVVKVIDAPADEPSHALANAMLAEMSADRSDVEVAWRHGQRSVVRAHYSPLSTPHDHVPAVRHGGTWVITGGARGITAQVAWELGRRFGLQLHLIGRQPLRSPAPELREASDEELRALKQHVTRQSLAEGKSPVAAWESIQKDLEIDRSLRKFRQSGISVTYHACDLADSAALAGVLDEVRRKSGPIEGIVHGAGTRVPARFEQAKESDLAETLGVKGVATLNLMEQTRHDPLKWFIGFGSVGGRFGTNGGTLYAMGNELLAKLTDWLSIHRSDCRTLCLHWHGWGEVGMMTRGASFGPQAVMKMNLMPPEEGIQHLFAEMAASFPDREVLFTDGRYHPAFYPDDVVQGTPQTCEIGSVSLSPSPAGQTRESGGDAAPPTAPCPLPLMDEFVADTSGLRGVAKCRLDPLRDPFLAQHRFKDRPLLPFVIEVELMAQAAQRLVGPQPVKVVENIEIVSGLRFFDDQPKTVRVNVAMEGQLVAAELVCDFHNTSGKLVQSDRPYARAQFRLDASERPDAPSFPEVPTHWDAVWYPQQREEVLYHGPIFRRLKSIRFDNQGGWAIIDAPNMAELAGSRSGTGWLHSPATLDASLFACGIYPWFYQDQMIAIPHSLDRLQLVSHPQANELCLLRFDYLGRKGDFCEFHFTLYGADRRILLRADNFRASIVPNQLQRTR